MAGTNKQARSGTKANKGRGAGVKARSPSSSSHRGSRVEPSHVTQQKRDVRATKDGAAKIFARNGAAKMDATKNGSMKGRAAKTK